VLVRASSGFSPIHVSPKAAGGRMTAEQMKATLTAILGPPGNNVEGDADDER